MKLLIEAPLNSLSFGNVSINLLKHFKSKGCDVAIFPTGNIDINAFQLEENFLQWIKESIDKRFDFIADKVPAFKLWHLSGGDSRRSPHQQLFTFYECSNPTNVEVAVCKSQEKTFFSSTYSRDLFNSVGCNNTEYLPLGFDDSFHITNKKYLDGVVHFGLMGKFEKRKHTANIIKAWLKAFGNDNRYQLTCCVTNPFFKPEQMKGVINSVLNGKRYTNINFLPYLSTNAEVNDLLNAIDIDLTGLSGGEGWNLPAFNATCLGKWSVVLNATSHKDWANADNSILIEPNGTMSVVDGVFFSEPNEFNQGHFFTWSEDDAIEAMKVAANKFGSKNTKGFELGKSMTYSNTVDQIIRSFSA